MRNFNAYINLQSNLSSSIDKFYEFNAKMEANAL
jgi:hypothetical protein